MEINTFIKATKFEKSFYKRVNSTIEFMGGCEKGVQILDIGEPNKAGKIIADAFGHEKYNTIGDLDSLCWGTDENCQPKYIYCFEVLEHLLNPLQFINKLRRINPKQIIITVPYHKSHRWGKNHWHEMDLDRVYYLFKLAGIKVVKFKKKYFFCNPFKIVRPKTMLKILFRLITFTITERYYFICEFV